MGKTYQFRAFCLDERHTTQCFAWMGTERGVFLNQQLERFHPRLSMFDTGLVLSTTNIEGETRTSFIKASRVLMVP